MTSDLADDDLERLVEVLRSELLAVNQAIDDNGVPGIDASPEMEARYIQLDVRRDLIMNRYRLAVRLLEDRRLDQIVEDARGQD